MALFDNENFSDDNEKNDFFDGPDIQETPEQPSKPKPKPEDPDYWEEDESEWDYLKPKRRGTFWLWLVLTGLLAGVAVAGWMHWMTPFVTEAVHFGYVEHIESRGKVFRTYEGVLLPAREYGDTLRLHEKPLDFSAADEKIATDLKRAMLEGRPVAVEYSVFSATLPWRGDSKVLITAVDSVMPRAVLPYETEPYSSTD